jgi:hypothetical protein
VEGGKEERPPKRSHHKKKNLVVKSEVEALAENLRDIYAIGDGMIGALVAMTGRSYPEGLFLLKDDVSIKLARNLLIVNDSVPQIGRQAAKYAAPVLLLTTFLGDITAKGMVLYGIFKSPKIYPGNNSTPGGSPGSLTS